MCELVHTYSSISSTILACLPNFDWLSVIQPFTGDYVGLRRNPGWKDVLSKNSLQKMDRYVVFADIVNKINRSNGKVGKELVA